MRPHNVPRIGDVEVMARLLLDLGAEVDGIGTTTLRDPVPRGDVRTRRIRRWSDACADRSCCSARCSHAADGAHRAAWRRLPGAPHDRHALAALRAMGARALDGARPRARGARRPEGRRRCISTRHRSPAPRRRCSPPPAPTGAPKSVTPRPNRTSSSSASSCGDGRRHRRAPARPRSAFEGVPKLRGADAHAVGRLHRGGQLGGRRRDHRRATSRSRARAPKTSKSRSPC